MARKKTANQFPPSLRRRRCLRSGAPELPEKESAFQYLEKTYEQRSPDLLNLKADPLLASLRTDPRYKAVLRKMNLPE